MAIPLRTLIVEDSEDDAALVVRELKRGGFDVDHIRVDTSEALSTALAESQWDIVISDYSMPGFSGAEALKILRAMDTETPFVFVSGTLGEETAVDALKSGAQDYVIKGKLARLVPAIQRELRDADGRRERKRLEIQIHQLRRFEAIGRLAGGIAHDFNNVIGAIMGWAELGQQEKFDEIRTRERFRKILRQAERAGGLTRQLLAFARRQVLQPHNLDLNILVRETVNLLGRVLGEQVQIELDLAPNLAPAWADTTQMEQVVMNLCINSRDAMPGGGQITIRTEQVEIHSGNEALRPYFRPGTYVLLSITDTGTGMDKATLEHIFEPFFTTKEVGRGTGLGLATVYGVVKQHNGFIEVDSKPGVGTNFKIFLPVGSGAAINTEQKTEERLEGGSETILVSEDHDGLRETAKETLEALGYRVLLSANGKEALELFRDNLASVDLVVLDVVMPELSGPVAFEMMTEMKPGLRAIFTTGYSREADSLRATVRGGISVIQKPYSSKILGHRVRALLDERN